MLRSTGKQFGKHMTISACAELSSAAFWVQRSATRLLPAFGSCWFYDLLVP